LIEIIDLTYSGIILNIMNYATFSKKKEKRGAQDCVDLRAISLVSYASKIVLKILTRRLESTAEVNLGRISFLL